jgi:diaminohydroxyphosphoribosylaminopyrimidine deaminase/5-amino-6-(5-phosphoribosylamino)uracil reductase
LKLSKELNLFNNEAKTIIFNTLQTKEIDSNYYVKVDFNNLIQSILQELYKQNIHSLIIEGGAKTLQSFIDEKLWDEARIFTTNTILVEGVKAPNIKGEIVFETIIEGDQLEIIKND